ncbi:STAS domain-containing protein [Micromonospora sp. FIMYZ51]|uniref:STAS domain-containing protein n=1 Tax=Micromonospora sp. FIMYZ51 TaxID=3051832 RepID=UPI00311EEA69
MTTPRRPECTVPLVEVAITEFDLACLPETGAVFDRLLALRPTQVVIDLSGCRHIDAAAIGLLLDVHRQMVREGGVLALRNPNPRIARILQAARLDQILPVRSDNATATHAPAGDPVLPGTVPRPTTYGRAAVTVRT